MLTFFSININLLGHRFGTNMNYWMLKKKKYLKAIYCQKKYNNNNLINKCLMNQLQNVYFLV